MSKAKALMEAIGRFIDPEIDEATDSHYTHDTMDKKTNVHFKGHKIGEVVHRGGTKHVATVFNAGNKIRKNKEVDSKEKGIEFIKKQHQKHGAFDDKID